MKKRFQPLIPAAVWNTTINKLSLQKDLKRFFQANKFVEIGRNGVDGSENISIVNFKTVRRSVEKNQRIYKNRKKIPLGWTWNCIGLFDKSFRFIQLSINPV